MIFLITAFYHEAKPFIKYFKLKNFQCSKFEIFSNNNFILIISGEGFIKSAIATTFLLSKFKTVDKDIALNVGICGAKKKDFSKGDVILCHKIINHHSQKAFYPDILVNHQMKEGILESFLIPVKKNNLKGEIEGDIIDMEGAGFFESASVFLPPHNIHCIKIVYDFLDYKKIEKEEVSELIEKNIPIIENFINSLLELNIRVYEKPINEEKLKDIIEKLKNSLHLTVSMTYELEKYLKSYIIRKGDIPKEISEFFYIDVKNKKERKDYFEKLKKFLYT